MLIDHNSGEIRINGVPLEKDLLRKISGFVPQQDLAVESLTVKEHMEFMVQNNKYKCPKLS